MVVPMKRYLLVFLSLIFLSGCEDTNVLVMTDAAADAVTALRLKDDDVNSLAQRAADVSDRRHQVASDGNPYAVRLRRLLADYSKRDGSTFNYKVYLTDEVNAFAMADGSIRIYSGLMDLMNDEELLFVIGHEMGHVALKHSRKQLVRTYASSALRKGLAAQNNEVGQIARSIVGAFAEKLTNAQFSQHEERQADQYGATFLQAEGYEMGAAVSALQKLAVLANQHTFLSSHPEPEARAERLLQGQGNEKKEQGSVIETLFEYVKILFVTLLGLVRSLVHWLLS